MSIKRFDLIVDHYNNNWKNHPSIYLWDKGPIDKLPFDFRVLEYPPTKERNMWTYSTCGMSKEGDIGQIEVHLFSSVKDVQIVELLSAMAYYHNNTAQLALNHTVNFGRPWQSNSVAEYGFISLPYLDGPTLENLVLKNDQNIKFYWLIPITHTEVEYRKKYGTEALEAKFDEGLDYLNPHRASLV